jgi:hypothetical protein
LLFLWGFFRLVMFSFGFCLVGSWLWAVFFNIRSLIMVEEIPRPL